jgi:sulfur carrier protein ThiS
MPEDPDDFFAPPPFNPETARATLARALRDLKLAERNGAFEMNGQPVVRVRVEGAVLKLDLAKKPSRSPDWEHADADDHARLRRFIDDVKRRVARWQDGRSED